MSAPANPFSAQKIAAEEMREKLEARCAEIEALHPNYSAAPQEAIHEHAACLQALMGLAPGWLRIVRTETLQ